MAKVNQSKAAIKKLLGNASKSQLKGVDKF